MTPFFFLMEFSCSVIRGMLFACFMFMVFTVKDVVYQSIAPTRRWNLVFMVAYNCDA